jgi:hypothetical protein
LKKCIAILILAVYLLSSTELHQLLKVPFLVEHFFEHKEQNKDITLWQFLCLHYADQHAKTADYEKDRKLPFKSHDGCCANFVAYIAQDIPSVPLIDKPIYNETQSFRLYKEVYAHASYLDAIWQPPRAC